MEQVIKHKDVGLLNMIRRTDPVIPPCGIDGLCDEVFDAVSYSCDSVQGNACKLGDGVC